LLVILVSSQIAPNPAESIWNQAFQGMAICACPKGDRNGRFRQNNSGCESEAAFGFRSDDVGVAHGFIMLWGKLAGWSFEACS
jgi:hypothetical protein